MRDEQELRKRALLDWTNELNYQQKCLEDPNLPEDKRRFCEGRAAEAKNWIQRINDINEVDDGGSTDFEKAVFMAKKLDPNINWYSEYTNGFHFMIKEDEDDLSDPGFAIAKADGKIYRGLEAHEFLEGDILSEGST